MATDEKKPGERVVTPKDLAQSLSDISRWVNAVRNVVLQLPAETKIVIQEPKYQPGPWIDYGDCMPMPPWR